MTTTMPDPPVVPPERRDGKHGLPRGGEGFLCVFLLPWWVAGPGGAAGRCVIRS